MKIEILTDPGDAWNEFVHSTGRACLGHDAVWAQILKSAYRLETRFLVARRDASITGVLPLAVLPRPIGRGQLISLPYLDSAGVLASDAESEAALLNRAIEIARDQRWEPLEVRNPAPLLDGRQPPVQSRVNLVLELADSEEAQWEGLRAKVRNQTRKAEKEGLRLADGNASELLDSFYDAFCVNMRDLGSPVHSRRLFEEIGHAFGARVRIIVVESEAGAIGGLVAVRSGETVYVPWASTLRSERKKCPNNMIYWEAIRWAVETGARRFDFGRSAPDAGTHRFKKGWGAVEEPLAWMRFDASGSILPAQAASDSDTMRRVTEVWARLPVGLTRLIGPPIRRYFGN